MKLKQAHVENFGSYENLDIEFSSLGLCLVYGPTGAGKSTLQDIVSWVLYGVTAKGGSVDEIRNWSGLGPTHGSLSLVSNNKSIEVTRIRGSQRENDLYFTIDGSEPVRGVNLSDTQAKLINELGCTEDQFLLSSYFNEFGSAVNFFTAKAKAKRQLFESLVDLSLANTLEESIAVKKKELNKSIASTEQNIVKHSSILEHSRSELNNLNIKKTQWKRVQDQKLEDLRKQSKEFQANKQKAIENALDQINKANIKIKSHQDAIKIIKENLTTMTRTCPSCGLKSEEYFSLIDQVKDLSHNVSKLETFIDSKNLYIETTTQAQNTFDLQVESLSSSEPKYEEQEARLLKTIEHSDSQLHHYETELNEYTYGKSLIELLADLVLTYRTTLISNAVAQIEESANKYLEDFFDSEIKLNFSLDEQEGVKVQIFKGAHTSTYTQLSKGQRGLLKLVFSVSVMKAAANNLQNTPSTLFFDEALDGLDTDLKLKTFNLFSQLQTQYQSILVIDHAVELQSLFDNKIKVFLDNDTSQVTFL